MKQRYDSYKSSGIDWIGDIPSHWNCVKTALIFQGIGSGTTPTSGNAKYYSENGINWLQTGDLNDGVINETSKKITELAINDFSTLKKYPKGSIVIAMYGATIGKIGKLNIETTTNQACCVLPYSTQVDKNFAFFAYQAGKISLINSAYGGGQPNISQETIKSFKIPIPPLSEQEAIAAWLDEKCGEIDAAIAKVDREIELIDELKQSEISRAVTRGLNPDAPRRPSGIDWIGDVPEHWAISPVKYSFNLFAGATPKTENAIYWDGEIVWITPADYKTDDHYISKGRKSITVEGLASCATEIVPINSLIFSKRAPIGTVSLANTPLCTNQGCISCVPKSTTNSNYFYYLCRIATKEFERLGSGATFLEISSSDFANFKMPLPPLSEQQAIADYLDKKCAEIDGLKAKLVKKRDTLKELRQSIISEVVTGKRKVI